jgi:arylsulfatase A-like enzyme
MYENETLPAAAAAKWSERNRPLSDASFDVWRGGLGARQVRRSRQGYYGSVTFIDEQIGRILETLENSGLASRTLVLYFSDHGDMTGDHHLWRKSCAYEPSARIPMILRGPGVASGETRETPVELRDVLPTLLDAAGATTGRELDGRSLLRRFDREFIDLEHDVCYHPSNHWNALTDGKWKYIYHARDGEQQLFHLRKDPLESSDLAGDPDSAAELRRWRQRMVAHLSIRGEPFVRGGNLAARPEKFLYSPHYPKTTKA